MDFVFLDHGTLDLIARELMMQTSTDNKWLTESIDIEISLH